MKKTRKIIGIVGITICVVVLLFLILLIIQTNLRKDKIVDIFGIKPMIVLSSSMENTLSTGDLAIIRSVDTKTLKQGDIIAFKNNNNTYTTHRITQIEGSNELEFTTKGDNNSSEDIDKVKENQIKGKYIFKIDNLGNFIMYIKEPQGLFLIMIIILILGLIWIIIGK